MIDGSHVRALKGGPTGPSPVDRARPGSKHHLITEAHGIPLAVSLTGGNRNDVTQLMPLIAAIPPVRGRRGRTRRRPDRVYADRGYDHDKYRRQVRAAGITPVIARRGTEHGSGLGVHRWVSSSITSTRMPARLRRRCENDESGGPHTPDVSAHIILSRPSHGRRRSMGLPGRTGRD